MTMEPYDGEPALGLVADEGRGSLPYALVHGEALVSHAARAMGDAGVLLVDARTPWEDVAGHALVLHDPCCPLTPAAFVAECVERAVAADVVVVGVRPVTDTVKALHDTDGVTVVGETVDREGLLAVCSPVVLPGSVTATLDDYPASDFATFVTALRAADVAVEWAEAPPEARRVTSPDDLPLLEALAPESA